VGGCAAFTTYVYGTDDIVSNSILQGGSWEKPEIDEVLWAMQQPVPIAPGSLSPGPNLFVDIGANLAWFALNVANRGYRVAAFEGEIRPQLEAVMCTHLQVCAAAQALRDYLTPLLCSP